jgi:DNA-binding transcriptional regulator YhcF (GntR family)
MTSLAAPLDPASPRPPFETVKVRVVEAVAAGELATGDRLPTVRSLAESLGIAPNTVARAYRELEQEGVLETRGRAGSFVAAHGDPRERMAQEAAAVFAARMRDLGVAPESAVDLVRAALHA